MRVSLAIILSIMIAGAASADAPGGTSASTVPAPRPMTRTLPPPPSAPGYEAWEKFANDIRDMWPRMYQRVPERLRHDPQVRAEVARLMLEAIAQQSLVALGDDGDHPVFLAWSNYFLNLGQPNADTIYRRAIISPGGSYRLRGTAGSLSIFKMGQFGLLPDQTGGGIRVLAYNDFSRLKLDPNGRFDVILSPQRPAGYAGDWWKLDPSATSLLLRQMGQDWSKEKDPAISIERIDMPARKGRVSAADIERRLGDVPRRSYLMSSFLVDHVEKIRKDGYINKLRVLDVSNGGALEGQFYYEGAYELGPDEALILEAKVPSVCRYSSIILTNDIYETTNWYDNQSSLNGAQYDVDKDGVLRIVIAGKDPGIANWLDTAGYPTGVVQGRWTDCSEHSIPQIRKVRLSNIAEELPAGTRRVTAEQRETILRERRSAYQQRPLW